MKQFQLQQVKFPKLQSLPQPNAPLSPPTQNPTAQSQMIRIIIALLIAIFIFNSSQQTTINYNEIIKNQKMFLVKNIRGVIPTLSGNVYKLQDHWKVVHFENYKQNDSQIFNNFTLLFNGTSLIVENKYCNTMLTYDWKNYSYNIDFALLLDNTRPMTMIDVKEPNNSNNQLDPNQSQGRNLENTFKENKQSTGSTEGISNDAQASLKQTQNNQQQIQSSVQSQSNHQQSIQQSSTLSSTVSQQVQGKSINLSGEQQKCNKNINYFKQVILFTSVWTISSKNLYLLMENAKIDEDFYMILKPIN